MWLVAAGLIVLLWIAYMICHAYVTARADQDHVTQAPTAEAKADKQLGEALAAKATAEQELTAARDQLTQARTAEAEAKEQLGEALAAKATAQQELTAARDQLTQARTAEAEAKEQLGEALAAKATAEQELTAAREQIAQLLYQLLQGNLADRSDQSKDESPGEGEDAWVPPDKFKHLDGAERSVATKEMFPDGCCLESASISPARDELTDNQVYQCRVVDANPALKDCYTVVNILADHKPDTATWPQYVLVEFDDLKIVPYKTDRNPIRYTLHATGVHLAGQAV